MCFTMCVFRIECRPLHPELSPESVICVPEHLGNLKYKVWEKMKDICPYCKYYSFLRPGKERINSYPCLLVSLDPVILNPSTAPPSSSVSDDLTSVTSCVPQNDPNPLATHSNHMVLGNVGYGGGIHTFTLEVGNSRHWTIGVCYEPLTHEDNCWGLQRDGDWYHLLTSPILLFKIKTNPEVVRVKIEDDNEPMDRSWRKVSFFDAKTSCPLAEISRVPSGRTLFPFVIPGERAGPLRVVPAGVTDH